MVEETMAEERKTAERLNVTEFSREQFSKMVLMDLKSTASGRSLLKKYKQSEVREIIENYTLERNQDKLREISRLLWAKSPQYQRLINFYSEMPTFSYVIAPYKDIKKMNKAKATKQYVEVAELIKMMHLKHEMNKVLSVAFREDIFFGYVHMDSRSFHIQQLPSHICKHSGIEGSVLNYSIDMSYFTSREPELVHWAKEIQIKYRQWKARKENYPKLDKWVELDPENTICIKVNEDVYEVFPPFAGTFDSVFDIDGFKQLRKDKEELGNYAVVTQKLPLRDSDDNNDFMIDENFMTYFHNQASTTVPDNVGVITSPMELDVLKFDNDKVDRDGVGKATRDFWEGSGTSQMVFSSDNTSSAWTAISMIADEQLVFTVLAQIGRWLNRFIGFKVKDLVYGVNILPVTNFNMEEMAKMYLEYGAAYGVATKRHLSATLGLEPIEVVGASYLENELLNMDEEWIPLQSSHTLGKDGNEGQPKKSDKDISDEGVKTRDKK